MTDVRLIETLSLRSPNEFVYKMSMSFLKRCSMVLHGPVESYVQLRRSRCFWELIANEGRDHKVHGGVDQVVRLVSCGQQDDGHESIGIPGS